MTIRLGPLAARESRWLRQMGRPASGWLKGNVVGRVVLVEALISRDLTPDQLDHEYTAALAHFGNDLLGAFFAFMPIASSDWFRGDLIIRIDARGVEAGFVPAGEEPCRVAEFLPVRGNGGFHVESGTVK